jgi:hypothetical protein
MDFGGSDDFQVFIEVPPTGGKAESTAVYLSPRLPRAAFGDKFAAYLREKRTIDQWTSLFASLEATPNPTSEEKDILAQRYRNPPPAIAFTPRVGRLGKRKADESSPTNDPDQEFTYLESAFDTSIPADPPGENEATRLTSMLSVWGNLVRNTNTLRRLVTLVYDIVHQHQEHTENALTDHEFATSLLANKLGERPASLGTDSIYQLLEDMGGDILKLRNELGRLDSPELEAARQTRLETSIGQTVIQHIQPLVALFRVVSTSPNTPGDLLEQRLRNLEAKITTHGNSPGSGFGNPWIGPTVTSPLQPNPVGSNTHFEGRIRFLEDQIKDMQDEMASSSVKVGTLTFVSRSQTRAWMDSHGVPPKACLFFLDAMSMLALMHSGSESAQAAAQFASVTKKVGYSSPDEALVVTSFSLELPEAFGALPSSGVARDSRILPALPTFKEWDGGDGYNGLKVTLNDKLNEFVPQMGQYYRSTLGGEALTIANEMLAASKLFIFELAAWINRTYQDTLARTTSSEKEAWALISHCVRVVFKLLRDARSSGSRWTPEAPDGDVQLIWAQLQCHRVMNDLRGTGFGAHPALSHVLNLHLQDNVVSRSRFEELEKRLQEVEKVAREAKKLADKRSSGPRTPPAAGN